MDDDGFRAPRADFLSQSVKCSSVRSLTLSKPVPEPNATLTVPGDKSITHRAFMLAAMANGHTAIVNPNLGLDARATLRALRQLGVRVRTTGSSCQIVGREDLQDPRGPIDCANSGTTMRLLMGLLAGRVNAVLNGDASLRRRPMARVTRPLNAMGAQLASRSGYPPIRVRRLTTRLRPIRYTMLVASAQLKSALLLAALRATASSTIVEPMTTRDHTERMLRAMGARLMTSGRTIRIWPSTLRSLKRIRIPGDVSCAVYLLCAAAAMPAATLRLRDIGINPTRTAALEVMSRMGADLHVARRRDRSAEPVADLSIQGGAPLRNVTIKATLVPNLIDEIPALCALACIARGVFSVTGASELRVKESDRIATTVDLLRRFGADARAHDDGITVRGGAELRAPRSVPTHGDHRIGMAAAILAAATRSALRIDDSDCIATSFPGFAAVWRASFAQRRSTRSS
jgi:3-phosphoshikimate 1-carboxyvinyltransferase